ncbi:MAG: DUF4097 family beta strand repeat-containing protein [Gemmatimonadaceae bacterium]
MRIPIRSFVMPLLIAGLIAGTVPADAQVTPPTPPTPPRPTSPVRVPAPPRPPRAPRAPRAWSGDDGVARIDTTVPFSQNGMVELSLVAGTMKLSTWNQNKVRVVASTSGPPSLQFDASDSHLSLEQTRNGSGGDRNNVGTATYDVTVPSGSRASLSAVSGDIDASGLRGRLEVSNVSGSVNVRDVGSGLSVEGVSGNVTVANVGGEAHVENVSGRISVTGVGGSASVETVSGGITLNGVAGSSIHATSVSGDLDFAGPVGGSARYNFETHSGRTNLRIAGNANAAIRVETFSGSVSNDYPGAVKRRTSDDDDTSSVDFIIGQGQGRLHVETFSGSVHISQGNP